MNRLQDSIRKYRLLEDDDSRTEMYNALLQADFYVPLKEDTSNNTQQKASFYVLKNSLGQRYLLAFSDQDPLRSYFSSSVSYATFSFVQILTLLKREEDLSGVLLDPQEGNMVFEKDLFEVLDEINSENPSYS